VTCCSSPWHTLVGTSNLPSAGGVAAVSCCSYPDRFCRSCETGQANKCNAWACVLGWAFPPVWPLSLCRSATSADQWLPLYPNHTKPNPLAQTLRIFLTRLLRLFSRFEWLGYLDPSRISLYSVKSGRKSGIRLQNVCISRSIFTNVASAP
jgi:hypothetical protein